MIFSNKPEQRSRLLSNQYYVTAAINKEGTATNRFLTIENYENEAVLGQCLEKKQCLTQFTIKKGAAPTEFLLSWEFSGDAKNFGKI